MFWSKVVKFLLIAGLVTLLVPLTLAQADSEEGGTVVIRDADAWSDQATITVTGLHALDADEAYEGWFIDVDADVKQSTGIISVDASGDGSQTFWLTAGGDPTGENLFARFSKFVVTIEPVPDANPAPSNRVALAHEVPAGAMAHIRHLTYSWGPNPAYTSGFHTGTPKGISVGLWQETADALKHANFAMGSLQEGNVSLAKLHIEHVVNYIVGGEGVDANGDGTISNLGDGGPGIILGDDGVGYADDHKHAGFAMGQAPNDATVNRHGAEALAGAANVEAWVTEALTQANRAVNSPSPIFVELWLRDTIRLLEWSLNGYDANGDGEISRTAGEAGVAQTYWAAQDMGSYNLDPPATGGPGAPRVGDSIIPRLPLYALIAGLMLAIGGGVLYWRSRRQFA